MHEEILPALMPTAQQLANAWFVTCIVLGTALGLYLAYWITEWLMDRFIGRFLAEPPHVVDLETRRRQLQAIARGRS